MIGAEQSMPANRVDRLMSEARPGLRKQLPALGQDFQAGIEGERAERHEHRLGRQKSELSSEVTAAIRELFGKRPICRRSAPARRRQESPVELEPVIGCSRVGAVCETHRVERPEQEAARLVSRKEPAGAISSVRCRSQADQKNSGVRIAERRERTGPVRLSSKAAGRVARGLLPPRDQARTTLAGDDLTRDPGERVAPSRAQSVGRPRP